MVKGKNSNGENYVHKTPGLHAQCLTPLGLMPLCEADVVCHNAEGYITRPAQHRPVVQIPAVAEYAVPPPLCGLVTDIRGHICDWYRETAQ